MSAFIKIGEKYLNIERNHCINISATTIDFCDSEVVDNKTTYTRAWGVITPEKFDELKAWLEDTIEVVKVF